MNASWRRRSSFPLSDPGGGGGGGALKREGALIPNNVLKGGAYSREGGAYSRKYGTLALLIHSI